MSMFKYMFSVRRCAYLVPVFIFVFSNSNASSEIPFSLAIENSKSIVVGTYLGARFGKAKSDRSLRNGSIPITKHIFEQVTIYKRNNTISKSRFAALVRDNGVIIDEESGWQQGTEPDSDQYADDTSAGIQGLTDSMFYTGTSDEVLAQLDSSDSSYAIQHKSISPGFEKGKRYILFIKKRNKKGLSPFHTHIFTVSEDGGIYSLINNISLIDVLDGNNLVWGYKPPRGIELVESTGGELEFGDDDSHMAALNESEFVRMIRNSIGVSVNTRGRK